jgi:hypothetical protein
VSHGFRCSVAVWRTILAIDGRPGESRPRDASWWLLCLSRSGFEGGRAGVLAWLSSVRQLEGPADEGFGVVQQPAWRRPISSGLHSVGNGSAVPEMATQRRGWPHRAGGDRGDALRLPCVTASSWMDAELVVVRLSRAPLSPFEGCGEQEGWEWAVQCHRVTPAISHNTCTASGMAAQLRVVRTAAGSDSEAVSGNRRGGDSPLTCAPTVCQSI